MPPPNATLQQLLDYLKDKATRYGAIAREHIEKAEAFRAGTDQIRPNAVQATRYEQAAREALQLAQQYTDYATWLSMLRPVSEVAVGDQVLLPATVVQRSQGNERPQARLRLDYGITFKMPLPAHAGQA